MKLFTVGPVEMYKETLEESGLQLPYFRTDEFSKVILQAEQRMLELARAPKGSRTIFLTASGTGAMEAAVINCLNETDHVLTIDGGSFGHRFAQICERAKIPQTVLHLEYGITLSRDLLDQTYVEGMTALLVNLHETSVGQLYDISMLSVFCKEHGLFLIVDAISAFLADPINMAEMGIDVLIISSQKALSLAPGISIVTLSPKAVEVAMQRGTSLVYFDFKDYLKNGERGQTPFTPAVGILLTLHQRLERISEIGLEQVQAEICHLAEDFRGKVKDLPVEIPKFPHSNALTPLYFPNGNAKEVYERLRRDYGITVNPNGGTQGDYLLRVSHIGNLTVEDNDSLVCALKAILNPV